MTIGTPPLDPATQALFAAIRADDRAGVVAALERRANLWARDPETDLEPMFLAAEVASPATLEALLEVGGTFIRADGRTPFLHALARGRAEIARLLHRRRTAWGGAETSAAIEALIIGSSDDAELLGQLLDDGYVPVCAGPERAEGVLGLARRLGRPRVVRELERRTAPDAVLDALHSDDAHRLEAWLASGGSAATIDLASPLTLLARAAAAGATRCVVALCAAGADPARGDVADPHCTPLRLALEGGHSETARALLSRQARLSALDRVGSVEALVAGPADAGELVPLLTARGARLRPLPDPPTGSHVPRAEARGHGRIVAALRAAEAVEDRLLAAVRRGDAHGTEAALQAGANPDGPEVGSGCQPLQLAAALGSTDVVELLIAAGADARCERWRPEEQPLSAAIAGCHRTCAALLLEHQAPLTHEELCAYLRCLAQGPVDAPELVEAMLSRQDGAMGVRHELGEALALAAGRHEGLAAALLAHGAPPRGLGAAAGSGQVGTVRRLLAAGARLSEPDEAGNTPLHQAIGGRGDARVVELLVAAGAALESRNAAGETPVELAHAVGREELARVIATAAQRAGPRWLRDARARGSSGIYLVHYSRAWGLAFNPFDVEHPLLTGGDHDGFGFVISPGDALTEWRRNLATSPALQPQVAWFLPFLEKLQRGEDFGLDELERAAPPTCRLRPPP